MPSFEFNKKNKQGYIFPFVIIFTFMSFQGSVEISLWLNLANLKVPKLLFVTFDDVALCIAVVVDRMRVLGGDTVQPLVVLGVRVGHGALFVVLGENWKGKTVTGVSMKRTKNHHCDHWRLCGDSFDMVKQVLGSLISTLLINFLN